MTQPTTIIYLTGKPGVGKYTIAKELAAKYGFIVCDNQLINLGSSYKTSFLNAGLTKNHTPLCVTNSCVANVMVLLANVRH